MYIGFIGSKKYHKEIAEFLIRNFYGNNINDFSFNDENIVYYIDKHSNITALPKNTSNLSKTVIFFDYVTFIKKYPFKVYDKVMDDDGEIGTVLGLYFDQDINDIIYRVKYDNTENIIKMPKEVLSHVVVNKSKVDNNEVLIGSSEPSEIIVDFDKYEIDEEKTTKSITVFKRKIKYPQTFRECYNLLNKDEVSNTIKNPYNINTLYKLLVCRDAYIKQYGDWVPNWRSYTAVKYCIIYDNGEIKPCEYLSHSKISLKICSIATA